MYQLSIKQETENENCKGAVLMNFPARIINGLVCCVYTEGDLNTYGSTFTVEYYTKSTFGSNVFHVHDFSKFLWWSEPDLFVLHCFFLYALANEAELCGRELRATIYDNSLTHHW